MGWGQLLGGAAGLLLAPATGGASLAAAGMLGATLGGAAEEVLGGGVSGAAQGAANQSAAATNEANALNRQIYEESIKRQQPFYDIGTNALNRLVALNQPGADVNAFLNTDPGYGFRFGEGMKALERSAAARGGLLSGGTGKALTRFGQDYGSSEYEKAYNRVAGLANLGPSAAGVMNTLGTNYGTNAGNAIINQGYTSGNALLAGANARQSSYGQVGSALASYLNPSSSNRYNYLYDNPAAVGPSQSVAYDSVII